MMVSAHNWPPRTICAHDGAHASIAICVAFLLAVSVTAHAAPLQEPATLCEQAITRAEAVGRPPLGMLAAVGEVESGL